MTIPQQRESSEPRGPLLVNDDEEPPTTHALVASARDAVLAHCGHGTGPVSCWGRSRDLPPPPKGRRPPPGGPRAAPAVAACAIVPEPAAGDPGWPAWAPVRWPRASPPERSWILVVGFAAADVLHCLPVVADHDARQRREPQAAHRRGLPAGSSWRRWARRGRRPGCRDQTQPPRGRRPADEAWTAFVATQSASRAGPRAVRARPARRRYAAGGQVAAIQATALIGTIVLVFGPEQDLPPRPAADAVPGVGGRPAAGAVGRGRLPRRRNPAEHPHHGRGGAFRQRSPTRVRPGS